MFNVLMLMMAEGRNVDNDSFVASEFGGFFDLLIFAQLVNVSQKVSCVNSA